MFTKVNRAIKLLDLVCFKPQRNFTSFDPKTSLATLEKISESMKSGHENTFKDLLILDKLNSTTYSETFRALNKQTKLFFSQKTIYFENDDTPAWNQVELLIKQHNQNDSLLINYKKDARSVQVIQVLAEIQKTTLGDFSEFYLKNKGQFETEILKEYAWQLFEILYRARSLGATCYDLSLQNIFIDYKDNKLKLHDYSDLRYFSDFYSGFKTLPVSYYLDVVLHTLAKMTAPPVTISNGEHARGYMKEKFPEFMKEFREIEEFAGSIKAWLPYDEGQSQYLLFELESRKSRNLPFDVGYNKFLIEKIKKANVDQIKLVEEAINQPNIDIQAHLLKLKTAKESFQGQGQYYKVIGDFEKACDYFAKALDTVKDIERIEQQQQQFRAPDAEKQERRSRDPTTRDPATRDPTTKINVKMTPGSALVVLVGLWLLSLMEEKTPEDSKSEDEKEPSSISFVIEKKDEKKNEQAKSIVPDSETKKKERTQLFMFGVVATLVTLGLTL